MTNKICKCGHEKERHFLVTHPPSKVTGKERCSDCSCKKFEPEEETMENHICTGASTCKFCQHHSPSEGRRDKADAELTNSSGGNNPQIDSALQTVSTGDTLSDKIRKIVNFHRGHNEGVMLVSEFEKHMWSLNKEFIKRLDNNLHYFEIKERENLHVRAFCKAFRKKIDKLAGADLT